MTDEQFFDLVSDLSDDDQRDVHRLWKRISSKLATGTDAEDDACNFIELYRMASQENSADVGILAVMKDFASSEAASYQRIADSLGDSWQSCQRINPN